MKQVERTYTARELEVEQRNKEIDIWNKKMELGQTNSQRPEKLEIGDKYTKTFTLPSKTIFWSKQAALTESGLIEARGYLYPELILLQSFGFELNKQPYALIETIRMMIRLVTPFLILVIVSLLTKPNDDLLTRQFFLKMRTRVRGLGPDVDKEDVNESILNPERTKDILIFPDTQLELYKWNKLDFLGFLISVFIVFVVIGTLIAFVKIL